MYWMKKIILVDQDGVLADFRGGFELKWPQYTDEPYTPPTTFYFSRSYPDRLVPLRSLTPPRLPVSRSPLGGSAVEGYPNSLHLTP